ncbi:MAG: glycosyltransferase, partial [Planctomycetota bacterium]
MKLMLLTPGTGHFYCGSCLRDSTLASAMRKLGHHVDVVPLYLPLVLEEHEQTQAVQMGGINVYLQQKTRLANVLPRFVTDLLDRPGLLRWASRRGNLTAAKDLGAMTLSMLQGEDGRQSMELDKLVAAVAEMDSPDVIVISNAMLSGMVRRLRQSLDCPVVATLQGEAPFLDALPEPFRGRAWQTLRERAVDIDKFVPVSHSYGDLMRE